MSAKISQKCQQKHGPDKRGCALKTRGSEPSNSLPEIKHPVNVPGRSERADTKAWVAWGKGGQMEETEAFYSHQSVQPSHPGNVGDKWCTQAVTRPRRRRTSLPGEQVGGKLIIIIIANTNGEQLIIKPFPALSCRSRAWCSQIQLCGELRRRES